MPGEKIHIQRLFTLIFIWTIITSVFAWLPLVRIIGRPDEYYWGIFGLSGEGTDGPYWIFIILTLYVLVMFFTGFRGPKILFYPLLILWHLAVTSTVTAGTIMSGQDATIQGQGLHWEFPMWIFIVPCALILLAAIVWSVADYRLREDIRSISHSKFKTRYFLISLFLLVIAVTLFRLGINYNWVTSLAIVITVVQWIFLIQSFEPAEK